MIRIKFKTFNSDVNESVLPVVDGEFLDKAIERCLDGRVDLGERPAKEIFVVLVNGYEVESDLWTHVKTKESDTILIAPRIKGEDPTSILRTIFIVAATIYTGGLAATLFGAPVGGIGAALLTAGASILASAAAFALFPPPIQSQQEIAGASPLSESQVYSLSGQSNQVRRYGSVPKVYGTHKMFPYVAANPFIEIEADTNGELVQYLYAIYDFGYGPSFIRDIRIGETEIGQYSDIQFNLVDPNKPVTNEGPWDEQTRSTFELYKKDVTTENVGVVLDANEVDAGPEAGYRVIRNATPNTDSLEQTLTLNVANTRGLFGFSANGTIGTREVLLSVQFAKIGTEDWYGFNDPEYVSYFKETGGYSPTEAKDLETAPFVYYPGGNETVFPYWGQIGATQENYTTLEATTAEINGADTSGSGTRFWATRKNYGLTVGNTGVVLKTDAAILPGMWLRATGAAAISGTIPAKITSSLIGKVVSIAPLPGIYGLTGYSVYTLDRPVDRNFIFFQEITGTLNSDPSRTITRRSYTVLGKIFLERGSPGLVRISRATTEQAFTTFKFTPKQIGSYKIKVTRISSYSTFTSQTEDSLTVLSLSTAYNRSPIVTDKRHTFLEMRVRATNQLNGVISNLSAEVSSVLPVWNGSSWVKQETRNPAWVFADLLTGELNKRAIASSKLNTASLLEWANFCSAVPTSPPSHTNTKARFESNFILDYSTTLQQVLNQVSSAANASLNIVDNKYGVLIDKLKTVPVQIFTPRNSSNFSSSRTYAKKPHALKVKFIDSGSAYEVSEVVVYDSGYDFNTATEFDEVTAFACTNSEQAWRYGRYLLAQNRLRQETISLTVDFEYLVCTRGDYVQITQDVMKVGGVPCRVRSVSGNQIVVDDGIDIAGSLGYVFRSSTGVISSGTCTQVSADTFNLTGTIPAVGNLVVIGNVGQIVYDCIVKSITPNDDLTATITLVEKADAIHSAESTDTFPVYDPQLNTTTDPNLVPPGEVEDLEVVANTWRCAGAGYEYYVDIDWNPPSGSAFEVFNVYADNGTGYNFVASTRESFYEYIVDQDYLGSVHSFKVIAVSATGKKLELGSVAAVTATPASKSTRPSDVEALSTDITGEVLQLVWPQVSDCDVDEYLIRYSPSLSASWATSIPLLRVDRNTTLAATQARTGTYLIKAVDFNGNESLNAAVAITTVPELFNLNIIEETSDFPALNGVFDRTVKSGNAVLMAVEIPGDPDTLEYYEEGFYYYENLLDLGDIFTVRLQSLVEAEGFTQSDMMSNWVTLSSVVYLSNARTSEWDVETQYRSTDTLNLMSTWATLSSVSVISGGSDDNFTPWRKFIVGDATGRIFQFRLRLQSFKPSVTPRVIDGIIRADMPDRVDSYDNLAATVSGYTLTYAPEFAGPGTTPNIQISMQDGQSGDYWVFTTRTLAQFTVVFYNSSNNPVARTFDAVVKGYGRKATEVI